MGKDNQRNKTIHGSSTTVPYSPWELVDTGIMKERQFHSSNSLTQYLINTDEFETSMDQDMTEAIILIEREQQDRIERNREQDTMEDGALSREVKNMDLSSSIKRNGSTFSMLQHRFAILETDQELGNLYFIPEYAKTPLVTLEQSLQDKKLKGVISKDEGKPFLCSTNKKVAQTYKRIGDYLCTYQSGRLPKAFRIIPSLSNWDQVLNLTSPEKWTSQAVCEVTKLFMADVKATQTKEFFEYVLLQAIRNNIEKNNQSRLDTSLYISLHKAIGGSPALFVKGLLLPLCESGTCTVTEAAVIASVVAHSRVPVLYTSTALLKLSELKFTIPNSILVLAFIEKKQALSYKVVDALVVRYFHRRMISCSQQDLPRLWFEALHKFVQSYGVDMVPTQKRMLQELVKSIKRTEMSDKIEKALGENIKAGYEEEEEDNNTTAEEYDDTSSNGYSPTGYQSHRSSRSSWDEMTID